jgi:8-oxo-dGTP diphosphatase
MNSEVARIFGDRVRVRVCGLMVEQDQILLINHLGLYKHPFWAPPGGGVQVGETATQALAREFAEEAGIHVKVCDFLFACEFIQSPLHAIELFFRVQRLAGNISVGFDPELPPGKQLIREVKWVPWGELEQWPPHTTHGIFSKVQKPAQILDLRGYFDLLAVVQNA